MMRHLLWALALGAAVASAAEVTVIRPKTDAFIGQEWEYYILLGDQPKPIADLRPGERVTLQVPAATQTIVIQCPKGVGANYDEARIDYDFKTNSRAFFVLTAKPKCVSVQPMDARAAAPMMSATRPRTEGRLIEYDAPKKGGGGTALVTATVASVPALTTTDSADKDLIAAATAAWVEAFNSRDPARMSALYDPEAVLADAAEPRARVGADAINDYYKSLAKRKTQRVALGERNLRLLGDTTAIDSGTFTYFEMRDGNAITTPGRYSFTYQKRGAKWVIVDHQTSVAAR